MDYHSLILIVDDQPLGQQTLGRLLETEGYRLSFAASGPEALAQMRLLAPDLVLLDVMMPGMDGFEVCRRIRADPTLALIPVVIVTALDDQASLLQGIEAGADDFVTKPFNRAELRARVRTITRLNRFQIVLDGQRRATSEHAQLLWAIERSADGYLLLDSDDRPQGGNAQGWHYLGLDGRPDDPDSEPFLALVRKHYQLEPEDAWASWPAPPAVTRYLVRTESTGILWLTVELLDMPHSGQGSRLVHLQDVTAKVVAQHNVWAFHSFVSHKLRTPLTSLLVGMGLIHRRSSTLPDDLAMLAETAYHGAQRLNVVVEAIFSYLNAPMSLTEGEGMLLADVQTLIAQISTELGLAPVHIVEDCSQEVYRLTINAQTIELLLTELLENARKFHPRNAPIVTVRLLQQGKCAIIRVVDDGVNLSPAQLRRIWEPYQQIDDDFTGQVAGVGLGLATVAQICWAAGGTCRIDNRTDEPGISVELELPIIPMQPFLESSLS